MTRIVQRVMHCPCGNPKVLALGLCSTRYTLRRRDEEYFGGLREAVLERDGYRCRDCDPSGRDKRSIIVHHRVPGKSVMNLCFRFVPVAMPRSIEQRRRLRRCRLSSWHCGESNIRKLMSKYRSTSHPENLPRSLFRSSMRSRARLDPLTDDNGVWQD